MIFAVFYLLLRRLVALAGVKGANTRIPSGCELVLVDQTAEQIATDQPSAADRQRWRRLPVTRRCQIEPTESKDVVCNPV